MKAAKSAFLFCAIFAVGLFLVRLLVSVPSADAAPKSQLQLEALLNGKPTHLGHIVLDGGSNTNASTLQPFTLPGGSVIKVECDAASRVGIQSACDDALLMADGGANANYCEAVAIQPAQKLYVVPDDATTIAAKGTPGKICVVWQMR